MEEAVNKNILGYQLQLEHTLVIVVTAVGTGWAAAWPLDCRWQRIHSGSSCVEHSSRRLFASRSKDRAKDVSTLATAAPKPNS